MSRLLLISDIHGFYKEFKSLLSFVGYNPTKDYLICLGDMIDRGPDGLLVVDWFKNMNKSTNGKVQSLFGNHEHMLLSYINNNISIEEYRNSFLGGSMTINNYSKNQTFLKTHSSFIGSLPLTLKIDNVILTHAKINFNKPLDKQTTYDTIWDYNKEFILSTIKDDNIYIFGHTPTFYINKDYESRNKKVKYKDLYEIWRKDNKICIDCTYHSNRKLCIFDITNDIEYYLDFNTKELYKK